MIQLNFIIICISHKVSILLKITRILKLFLRSIIDFYLKKRMIFFSQHIIMESSRHEEDKNIEDNIIQDVRNLFRLKKFKKRNK